MNRIAVSVLVTHQSRQDEVLLVKRNPDLKFLGGYLAFPGGVLDEEDEQIPVKNLSPAGQGGDLGPFLAAAVRELLEETGIWLAQGPSPLDGGRLREYRRKMLGGDIRFSEILRREGQFIDARFFTPIGRITTPPYSSRRYDTWFVHCRMPAGARLDVWPGELHEGAFHVAQEALASWRQGEMLIAPPVITLLQEMTRREWNGFRSYVRDLTEAYQRGKLQRDYYSCGVLMCPLKTRTKPPATHTNFFVVGDRQLYLIDPAASEPREQEKLWELLDELVAERRILKGILLTHGHPDHIGAVVECRRRYGLPVYAHRLTAEALPEISFDGTLEHGQELELGASPDGLAGWSLRVYHLPGHAPGHVVFQESRYRALIVGDLVSTLSSILVDPADGHLGTYLKSLEFLESIAGGVLYPGHGPPVLQSRETVWKAIEHRRSREQQLLAALTQDPQPAEALLEKLYSGLPASAMRWARRSLHSGLIKLIEEGRVQESEAGYRLAESKVESRKLKVKS